MATEYSGVKWGDGVFGTAGGTVTYSFAAPSSPSFYSYTAQLDATYQAVVEDALEQWSTYADIDFVLTYDVASADITLGWDRVDGYGSTIGETIYQYMPVSNELAWAEIRFDVAEDWAPTNDATSGWETSFYAVALHEIGHAIGLDHTTMADSIMYAVYGYQFELTAGDIAGIQALYGPAPDAGFTPPGVLASNSIDSGGWNYGWSHGGGWAYGWHTEAGWDQGWYLDGTGWHDGWFFHQGWEYGWHGTGAWQYGWYVDYGGYGWGGTNTGWQAYGWNGGYLGHEGWGWSPASSSSAAWFYGDSIDQGGWNYGWYEKGGWGWGWHIEGGWDYGWYETAAGWGYGWFTHQGWEYGWYGTGGWQYGWYVDYGGLGLGWNIGWQDYGWAGGWAGHESYF